MDRFDKAFNEIDTQTARPFTAGHPDGVWFSSIVYGMPIVLALVLCIGILIAGVFFMDGIKWPLFFSAVGGVIILSVVLVPIIFLLFRRSRQAFSYAFILSLLFLVVTIAVYFVNPAVFALPLALLLLQLCALYYCWGLKKDGLLS